jgi:hypothetical protein
MPSEIMPLNPPSSISDPAPFFSFIRGFGADKPVFESHKFDFLIEHFVDVITSKYNQDISLLIVGNKGKGKSLAALSLCYYSGCELAERLGGKWTDYFNPETNMAVITPESANRVMSIEDKYAVKNFDDIGIGWGARNWQDKENKEKNDIFQINRIDQTIQVFSVPNQFLLDKVPRSLVSHYAEMDQQFFEYGFTTIKLFKPITLFREGKLIQPYLSVDRTKFVLYRIPKPPDDLIQYYSKVRKASKEEAVRSRLGGVDSDKGMTGKPLKKNIATQNMEKAIQRFEFDIMNVRKAGGDNADIRHMLTRDKNVPLSRVKYWIGCGAIDRMYPPSSKTS